MKHSTSALLLLFIVQSTVPYVSLGQDNAHRIRMWQEKGVHFSCPEFVFVDTNIEIGTGTSIGAGVHLLNGSTIGCNCIIEPFCMIEKTTIEDDAIIYSHTVLQDATIKKHAKIGPFARIRKNSTVESSAEIGNFVEMSDSTMGENSKAKHLTYLGCTTVEETVNIGAGTITCNYDGFGKHTTRFERGSFIGSHGTFVAPITVGKNAITASGSVFTQDVPDNALSIARSYQINKPGYATQLRDRFKHRTQK